jgi:hypothetical protein
MNELFSYSIIDLFSYSFIEFKEGCLKRPVIAGLTCNPLQIVNAKLLVINH